MDSIRETSLRIAAVFLVWFSIIFGIGIALLVLMKLTIILFPGLNLLIYGG